MIQSIIDYFHSTKTEKEKKKQAQEAGMVRAEISGAEVSGRE